MKFKIAKNAVENGNQAAVRKFKHQFLIAPKNWQTLFWIKKMPTFVS